MNWKWIAVFVAMALAAPAAAQRVSDVDAFVTAVRDRDGNTAVELIREHGSTVLNGRNYEGETGLIVAIEERVSWIGYLLQQGANPNLTNHQGKTPLITAARIGHADAVEWLLRYGADVNGTNRMGETALIVAVQQRQIPVIKLLLDKGADPDQTDNAAGYSARDYAKRDTRSRRMIELIEEAAKKPAATETKSLDEFKLR